MPPAARLALWLLRRAYPEIRTDKPAGFVMPFGFGGNASNWTYRTYAEDGMCRNPIVYACINEIASACSSVRLELARGSKQLDPERLSPSVKLLQALLRRPNRYETIDQHQQHWAISLHLAGNCCDRMVNVGERSVALPSGGLYSYLSGAAQLVIEQPDTVEFVVDNTGELTGYKVKRANGVINLYTTEEVLAYRFPHPLEPYLGLSPLKPLAGVIDAHNASLDWNRNLLEQRGVPAGVLILKGLLDIAEEDRKRIETAWQAKFGGPSGAGKTHVQAAEGAEYHQLGRTPVELDWLGGQREMMRQICAALGVPSKLLNDPEQGTYANYREARRSFYHEIILPLMSYFIAELNDHLVPQYDPEVLIQLDVEHIDALRDDEYQKALRLRAMDFLTQNEKRREFDYNPVDDPAADKLPPPLAQRLPSGPKPEEPAAPRKALPASEQCAVDSEVSDGLDA